jgi:phospholipase C
LPPGTDTIPQIEHIVVVMLENHTFDNILGALGRGDGLPRKAGAPSATNLDGKGHIVRSFHMPTPCQLPHQPWNTWQAGHDSYDGGRMDGFVRSPSGPVSMGFFTRQDLPFTWSLAETFPIGDRYFSSVMAQTYPNRRFMLAGTSLGLLDDSAAALLEEKTAPPTILSLLDAHGITWRDYHASLPTVGVFLPLLEDPKVQDRLVGIEQFYVDAANGTLPGFSLLDPDFGKESEENPQDVQYGDAFLARVVDAVTSGPSWSRSLLVWCYDEGGGYFDHVPPPSAVPPDDVQPIRGPADLAPGGFDLYGFRVPFGVVSPYARPGYVSHVVHDHTSILKLLETKWNLPALTRRDANASDLLDSLDLSSAPAYLVPPALAKPVSPADANSCTVGGPGVIPPPGAVRAIPA